MRRAVCRAPRSVTGRRRARAGVHLRGSQDRTGRESSRARRCLSLEVKRNAVLLLASCLMCAAHNFAARNRGAPLLRLSGAFERAFLRGRSILQGRTRPGETRCGVGGRQRRGPGRGGGEWGDARACSGPTAGRGSAARQVSLPEPSGTRTGLNMSALPLAAVTLVLGSLGFTGSEIAASSTAAKMISPGAMANGGGECLGGLVATLQSVGSAALSLSSKFLLGTAGPIFGA
nr:interferon alpha-inducible protein 27-like protein 2B isoform X2 [Microcebus murinus]